MLAEIYLASMLLYGSPAKVGGPSNFLVKTKTSLSLVLYSTAVLNLKLPVVTISRFFSHYFFSREKVIKKRPSHGKISHGSLFVGNTAYSQPVRHKLRLCYARPIAGGVVDLLWQIHESRATSLGRLPLASKSFH